MIQALMVADSGCFEPWELSDHTVLNQRVTIYRKTIYLTTRLLIFLLQLLPTFFIYFFFFC